MRILLILMMWLTAAGSGLVGQAGRVSYPLWAGLEPGRYGVGHRLLMERDPSRTFPLARNRDAAAAPAPERDRPLQLRVWYPSPPGAAPHMTYAGYLRHKPARGSAERVAVALATRDVGLRRYAAGRYLPRDSAGLTDRLLRTRTAAVRDAPAAPGRHPVVVYSPGANQPIEENAALAEYLASHGYVVVALPALGPESTEEVLGPAALETRTRDLEFALGRLRALAYADPDRVALAGFSYGGMAALLAAMRNAQVDAVVGLDPSFTSSFHTGVLRASPFYDPARLQVPVLHLRQTRASSPDLDYSVWDSLRYARRYAFEIHGLGHIDFTGYAAAYLGALAAPERADSALRARAAAYAGMARRVRAFLAAHLQGVSEGEAALRRADGWSSFPAEQVQLRVQEALPVPPSVDEFAELIRRQGIEQAERNRRELRGRDPLAVAVSEAGVNQLGYLLLGSGNADAAVRVLGWNVEANPTSANAYDSLADALRARGDTACVAWAYRKLLEVVPNDPTATATESVKAELRRNAEQGLARVPAGVERECRMALPGR